MQATLVGGIIALGLFGETWAGGLIISI